MSPGDNSSSHYANSLGLPSPKHTQASPRLPPLAQTYVQSRCPSICKNTLGGGKRKGHSRGAERHTLKGEDSHKGGECRGGRKTHHRHMITVALRLAEHIQHFVCLGEPAREPHPSSEHNSLANTAPPVLLFGHSSFHHHVHKHAHSINNHENGWNDSKMPRSERGNPITPGITFYTSLC